MYPPTVEVLGLQLSVAEWLAAVWEPSPDSAIVSGEFVALLATLMLPETMPAATGANRASSVADWPGVRIKPAETPLVE